MTYLLGIIIGLVLGLTGAGGSVFAVPLLITFMALAPQQAIGISLGAVCIAALYGVLVRIRSKEVQWLPALVFASIGSLFAPIGNILNRYIPDPILLTSFALLICIIAIRMWLQASKKPELAKVVRVGRTSHSESPSAICKLNANKPFTIGPRCVLGISAGAVLTGLLSGLFGVGGGFLIVPTLLFLTGINMTQAVATSLVVIAVISGSGFVSFILSDSQVQYLVLLQVALGGIAGMTIGVFASRKLAGPSLQKMFSILMLIMAGLIILKNLN